jgi:hypothetical protein
VSRCSVVFCLNPAKGPSTTLLCFLIVSSASIACFFLLPIILRAYIRFSRAAFLKEIEFQQLFFLFFPSFRTFTSSTFLMALTVFSHNSRLYFTGRFRRFSNSSVLSLTNSRPVARRNALVQRSFFGFLFI